MGGRGAGECVVVAAAGAAAGGSAGGALLGDAVLAGWPASVLRPSVCVRAYVSVCARICTCESVSSPYVSTTHPQCSPLPQFFAAQTP